MKKREAFSLIEVLIAIFIFEIGILAVVTFYTYGFTVIKTARNETVATNLATGLLENELSLNYDNIPVGDGTKRPYTSDATSPFYDWQEKIDVNYIDLNLNSQPTDTNMKKIKVTIYWQDRGQEKSLETSSIKARH